MLKKIVSYVGIYTILFNSIYSVFIVDQSFAQNDLKLTQPSNKTYNSNEFKDYSTDTLIIKFKNSKSRLNTSSITNTLSSFGKSNIEMLDDVNIGLVHFEKPIKEINKVVTSLKSLNNVEYVEPDYVRNLSYTGVVTTDTHSNTQWYLDSINAQEAWEIYNDTENKTIVSVNDSGIDYSHLDIGSSLRNLSTNCKDDSGNNIIGGCPNNGWNFEGSGSYNPATAVLDENEIYDINGHGTHVAGIIGAEKNNSVGIVGVTQNSEIMGARVYSYHDGLALFYVSNTIRALNFAIQNGAKVVNASYGGTNFSQAEYDAIEIAKNNGLLIIAAAGNSSTNNDGVSPFYPASYDLDNIISVASVGGNDELASYSNYGVTSVDIAAPGGDIGVQDTGIFSTYPYYQTVWSHDMNSFSGITQTGTGLAWNIYNGIAIESQSGAFNWNSSYNGNEDKTLVFNQTFDLSGAKFAKFSGYIECELSSGDNFEVIVNDQVIGNAYPNWTYARAVAYNSANVELPIPSNLYTSGSQVKVRFVSDGDSNQSYGCTLDDFSIDKYQENSNSYASIHGTSMATPVVTGVAAMLWSYKPDLTYSQVKDIILTSKDTIPSLSTKVATSGKINSQKAIQELISRYGITKNGDFGNTAYSTSLINLNGKSISLSGSSIIFSNTGTLISLSGSNITGNGEIFLSTGTSLYNNGVNFLNIPSDFNVITKDGLGNIINGSGITYSGSSLILDYTGSLVGTGVNVTLGTENYSIYDGPLLHNLTIPVTNNFTGSLGYQVYTNGYVSNGISSSVKLWLSNYINADNFTFNYVGPQTITGSLSFASGAYTNSTGTILNVTSSVYPVNYQITGDLLNTQTGTLNSTGAINLGLTSGDGVKNVNLVLTKSGYTQSENYTGSITLDKTNPIINISSYTNNQQVNTSSITLTGTVTDTNSVSSLLINGTGVTLSGNTFSKNVNLVLGNNTITYQATDLVGNVSTGSINIERINIPTITGALSFASGAYTNSTGTILNVTSSVYPVNYQITGDLLNTQTGTLNSTGAINLGLTSGDGVKSVNLVLTQSGYTQSQTYTGSIRLDKTNPIVNILSHTNNQKVNTSSITLTGNITETNGVSSLLINGSNITLSGNNFSKNITLSGGINIITYQVTDMVGNSSTGSINIERLSYNVDNNTGNTNNTGSLLFLGNNTSSTGAIFNSTGSITINSATGSHRVVLSLSGLTISSSSWDGIFNPPSQISFSGTFNNSGYTHIPSLTFDIGSHNTELNLTGTTAQINLFVGTSQNGRTLSIFRSTNNGVSYSLLTTCLVSSGICSFNTDKFSLFTLATSGSSSSSSSSSSTSGGGSSSGGASLGATVSTAAACTDAQLECRTITTGSGKTNKWYKKDGVTCEGGNLGKMCSIDNITQSSSQSNTNTNIKKLKPVKDLLDGYKFKSKAIENIFKQKSPNLIKIDDDLSNIAYLSTKMDNYREDYRTLYTKLVESAKKLDELLAKKDSKAYQEEYKNFLSINTSLNNYKTDLTISFVQVGLDKVYYLKYKNTKIDKIQSDLFKKINKKQANTYMYRLANKVAHNLNELLTNKALTKDEILTIRTDTINTYKEFIIQYNKLAKK